ncbi:MAG: hypothetical protein E7417_02265 [Ruminococcaceae bacterium]|nr:hypothetical protein [Oscillospiraceae bacterium]
MEREYFDEVTVRTEDEQDIKLTYYLLKSTVSDGVAGLRVYGVEIVKELISGKHGKEAKLVRELFIKKAEAKDFLASLCRNTVTPMGLKYVISDYFFQKTQENMVNSY